MLLQTVKLAFNEASSLTQSWNPRQSLFGYNPRTRACWVGMRE